MSLFKKKAEVPEVKGFMLKQAESIDLDKRYDIYTHSHHEKLVVYRNVKFLGTRSLPGDNPYSAAGNLLLIQQDDGTECLISAFSYFCICEHGKKPVFEITTIDCV